MKSDATRRKQLEDRLEELRGKLSGIEDELGTHDSADWEDQATEREDEEVLVGMGEAGRQEIRMIEAALDRMEQGEYGFCVTCGKRISEERLDILPQTPFCKDDAI